MTTASVALQDAAAPSNSHDEEEDDKRDVEDVKRDVEDGRRDVED